MFASKEVVYNKMMKLHQRMMLGDNVKQVKGRLK
jgi:hypothetical protein